LGFFLYFAANSESELKNITQAKPEKPFKRVVLKKQKQQ
jgi:hypothetical protein